MSHFEPKSLEEIRKQCFRLGLFLDATFYEKGETDFIEVKSFASKNHSRITYNVNNGSFVGTDSLGGQFQFSFDAFNAASTCERAIMLRHARGYMKDLIHFFLWEVE